MQNPHLVAEFKWLLFNQQLITRNPLYPWKSSAFQLLIGNSLLVRCGSRGKTLHLWTVLSSSVNLASIRWSKGKSTGKHGTSGPKYRVVLNPILGSVGLQELKIIKSADGWAAKQWWLADVDSLCGPSWATNRPTNYIWAIPKWCTERCSHKTLDQLDQNSWCEPHTFLNGLEAKARCYGHRWLCWKYLTEEPSIQGATLPSTVTMQNLRWLGNDLKFLYTTASLPIAVRNNLYKSSTFQWQEKISHIYPWFSHWNCGFSCWSRTWDPLLI